MALNDATLPNVIADAGATLRQVLRDQIAEMAAEERIVFSPPGDVQVTTEPRLGLFLYQVLETPEMRNHPPEPDGLLAARRYQAVDLFFLVTPYSQDMEDSHRLLGRVIRVFFERAVLDGSVLQGSLADIGQPLRILLHPLTLEDLTRLWAIFPNEKYQLSVAYQVTPVKVFGGAGALAGRVITREHRYAHVLEKGEG